MYGAILGDMVGAPYEFKQGSRDRNFEMWNNGAGFTDDTVMTIAVADALLSLPEETDDDAVKEALVRSMQRWGRRYPDAGYGQRFSRWLRMKDPKPYGSWGNGSAMRVSSVGWLCDTLEETRACARLTAEVTHNHPEGIRGAEAAASAIFLGRTGASKEKIREYLAGEFGYDLSRTCDEIRMGDRKSVSCQKTVPEAVRAFLEGEDFEDVIRTAVSLGGDCDTIACIAGGMAEAYYGIPEEMKAEVRKRLGEDMRAVLDRFEARVLAKVQKPSLPEDPTLSGNERMEEAIQRYCHDASRENLKDVLEVIRKRMHEEGHLLHPVRMEEGEETAYAFRSAVAKDGSRWIAAFTSPAEYEKGESSQILSLPIDVSMKLGLEPEYEGLVINPWGEAFRFSKDLIREIFREDGDVEYFVPEEPITEGLLEDGSYLKRAVGICCRNHTAPNLIRLSKILRDSWVWIPCTAVLGDADYEAWSSLVREAQEAGDLDALKGQILENQENIRMVPDILADGDNFFFPVFTSEEEMGEYGENFSKICQHFLDAEDLARNNQRKVAGIVINPFTDAFVVPLHCFDLIADLPSGLEEENPEKDVHH
ncbi:MAG: ADP-ribosylglycohydrolase family protein [Lachnospiraceae bacterium]